MWAVLEKLSGEVSEVTNELSLSAILVIGLLAVGAAILPLIVRREHPWLIVIVFSLMTITVLVAISLAHVVKQHEQAGTFSVKPNSTAIRNPNSKNNDYIIWLDGASIDRSIAGVEYSFSDPTATLPRRTSYFSQNGYAVSYRGWHCYDKVDIQIIRKSGEKERIEYNMCNDTKI